MRDFSRRSAHLAMGLAALTAGCSSSSSPTQPGVDAGHPDTSVPDTSVPDASVPDGKAHKDAADAKGAGDASQADAAAIDAIPVTQTITASSLSAPVDVVRDQYGIPHIYGQTLADVVYAEAYVMSSDRLVEMDLGRRQAEGTLSELFGVVGGPALLAADVTMRMNNLKGTATTSWQALQGSTDANDQAIVKLLTSFAAGVNAFVADVNAGKASLPANIGYDTTSFSPWTEVDSVALSLFQAFELAFDPYTEMSFTQAQQAEAQFFDSSSNPDYTARKGIAKDLEILTPQDPTFILPSGWTDLDGGTSEAKTAPVQRRANGKRIQAPRGALAKVQPPKAPASTQEMLALLRAGSSTLRQMPRAPEPLRASNNFIIGPSLTADGHPIVANDMHLSLSNPPVFYIVQLVASGGPIPLNVMGVNFPGIPGVVQGNNQHIAWGMTDAFADVTDVYAETVVNCSDGSPYSGTDAGTATPCVVFNGQNVALTPRVETFNIGLDGTVSSTDSETFYDVPQHGPIIPTLDSSSHIQPLGSSALSIKYTGYQPSQLFRGLLGVLTATTMQDAVTAIDKDFVVGGQNWVIGDDQGNFGWTQACSVPVRPAANAPYLVMPGTGAAEWNGMLDRHFIPHAYNPQVGYIVSANNDPIGVTANNSPFFGQPSVTPGYPLYVGFDYEPGMRAGRVTKRIQALVSAGHKITLDDVPSIQGDRVSEWDQAMAPTFVAVAADLAAEIATPGSNPSLTAIVQAADSTAKGLVQQAHDIVAAWTSFDTPSGVGSEATAQNIADSQATLLTEVFYANFSHLTFDDELSALSITDIYNTNEQPFDDLLRKLLVRMCTDPSSLATKISPATGDNILFDNLNTTGTVESKEQVAAQAILNSLDYLAKTLGTDPTTWAWGNIHTLTLDYLLYTPPSTWLDNLNLPAAGDTTYPNGYPRHGNDGTVDVGAHGLSLTNFTYNEGPSVRFGAEVVPGGVRAQNALPGGETFDPASPHYQDQLVHWLAGQPFPLAESVADVAASASTEYTTNKDGRIHFQP